MTTVRKKLDELDFAITNQVWLRDVIVAKAKNLKLDIAPITYDNKTENEKGELVSPLAQSVKAFTQSSFKDVNLSALKNTLDSHFANVIGNMDKGNGLQIQKRAWKKAQIEAEEAIKNAYAAPIAAAATPLDKDKLEKERDIKIKDIKDSILNLDQNDNLIKEFEQLKTKIDISKQMVHINDLDGKTKDVTIDLHKLSLQQGLGGYKAASRKFGPLEDKNKPKPEELDPIDSSIKGNLPMFYKDGYYRPETDEQGRPDDTGPIVQIINGSARPVVERGGFDKFKKTMSELFAGGTKGNFWDTVKGDSYVESWNATFDIMASQYASLSIKAYSKEDLRLLIEIGLTKDRKLVLAPECQEVLDKMMKNDPNGTLELLNRLNANNERIERNTKEALAEKRSNYEKMQLQEKTDVLEEKINQKMDALTDIQNNIGDAVSWTIDKKIQVLEEATQLLVDEAKERQTMKADDKEWGMREEGYDLPRRNEKIDALEDLVKTLGAALKADPVISAAPPADKAAKEQKIDVALAKADDAKVKAHDAEPPIGPAPRAP